MAVAAASSGVNWRERKLPPMLEEYLAYKEQHPDHFLFFQVGDFYEVFFDDAPKIAKILNVTLTSRDKKDPNPIPMCGVPQGAIEAYLERLLDAGYSAALVSQVPGKKPAKGMVERRLERVVTPGVRLMTITESKAESRAGVVVAVGATSRTNFSIAWGDAASSDLTVLESIQQEGLLESILRLEPSEVILPLKIPSGTLSRRLGWIVELEKRLPPNALRFRNFDIHNTSSSSQEFSLLGSGGKRAARLFLQFIEETTVSSDLSEREIRLFDGESSMTIDTMTRKNLELVETAKDSSFEGSLLHYLDRTRTVSGTRLLRNWLLNPLTDEERLTSRYEAVSTLLYDYSSRSLLGSELKKIPDLDRIAARAELHVITPRELGALRDGLEAIIEIANIGSNNSSLLNTPRLRGLFAEFEKEISLYDDLKNALADTPPVNALAGGIVRDGFSEEVDSLKRLANETEEWLEEFQQAERERTGITSLKVKSNNAVGLFIELTKTHQDKAPAHYIPRQTLTSGVRFTTEELREWEKRLTSAALKLQEAEIAVYKELQLKVKENALMLRKMNEALSELDVYVSFADCSEEDGLTPPKLMSQEQSFISVRGGWHPVLKSVLKERCIVNDLEIGKEKSCLILTGPNMGGKSTYLRQAGLLVVMAQIGCFVPAEQMEFSLFDRVFARLGASDDLHEGESTFMVEMKEASNIVSNATKSSLVLIDEIGRGTATADGLSIARAILEWIVSRVECRCLFATHYHQLIEMEKTSPAVKNISVKVEESGKEVVFTHVVGDGPAGRSYGIEVAKRAGLPKSLLQRASILLDRVMSEEKATKDSQLSIFSAQPVVEFLEEEEGDETNEEMERLKDKILAHSPDTCSPREALELLYDLYELCS